MSRFVVAALAAVMALGSFAVGAVVDPAPTLAGSHPYAFCPRAKRLVTGSTHFTHRRLAPGVRLAEATLGHHHHRLRLSVVRVDLHNPHSKIAPLHHAITSRHPLSKLARQPHLLAATNGTYFNYTFGSPTVPFVSRSGPVVLSHRHERVAGISVRGRAQDGDVWLVGRASNHSGSHRLLALNDATPPAGLSVYTGVWGRKRVPLPLLAKSLAVRHGRTIGPVARRRRVPPHGDLLVATTPAAVGWLAALHRSRVANLRYHVNTDAKHPFQQAYGVGTQVVATANHVRSGLYCRVEEIYAARTDFAWRRHGRQLILATIESPRGSERYGVDENQMSQVMVGLGAARSYALDGGGSTELVARLPHGHRLSIRTPRRKGHERPIPLGIGVYSMPGPTRARHHDHHHGHSPKPPARRCVLGLLCH